MPTGPESNQPIRAVPTFLDVAPPTADKPADRAAGHGDPNDDRRDDGWLCDDRQAALKANLAVEDLLDRFALMVGPLEAVPQHLLPTRQCEAAAAVLAVDAVGISVLIDGQKRVPLGASSADASVAESLEFTLGEGPCLLAHAENRPVLVPDVNDAAAAAWSVWPEYSQEVLTRTPFRAVFGLPLSSGELSLGSVSLYRREPGALSVEELAQALAVANRIFYDLLDTGMFGGELRPMFRWLNMPLAMVRGIVWQAIGVATVEMGLNSADALALIRSYCYANHFLLDQVAADIIARRLPLDELQP